MFTYYAATYGNRTREHLILLVKSRDNPDQMILYEESYVTGKIRTSN